MIQTGTASSEGCEKIHYMIHVFVVYFLIFHCNGDKENMKELLKYFKRIKSQSRT